GENPEGDESRNKDRDRQCPVDDLKQREAVVGEDGVKGDLVFLDVAADLRVVDDHGEHGDREEHQGQDFQELAQDVAVENVREGDVEAAEHLRLVDLRGGHVACRALAGENRGHSGEDRKSTRLNSSHANISYAV